MKNIEWLKEAIGELPCVDTVFNSDGSSYIDSAVPVMAVYDLLDQLDEPEVLSQELPVIPKFVAEWYEKEGNRNSWWNWFYKWGRDESRTELESKTIRWMQDFNEELFVDMFGYGYEVEKEQKYYVLNNEGETMIRKDDSGVRTSSGFKIDNRRTNEGYKLTEQEIKDYDERYWPFAVKVEELEE